MFDLNMLMRLLGITESKAYKEYKYLKRDVLGPAMREINSKSDIEVCLLSPLREGRRVVGVQFGVQERRQSPQSEGRVRSAARLERFGVVGKDAEAALDKFTQHQLDQILDDIERRWEKGLVRKPRPYTATVLREFSGDPMPPLEQEREAKRRDIQRTKIEELEGQTERRTLRRKFEKFKIAKIEEEERTLSPDQVATLKHEFVEHLKNEEPYGYQQYLKRGTAGKLVQNLLLQFKVRKLLPLEEQVFEEWLQGKEETA